MPFPSLRSILVGYQCLSGDGEAVALASYLAIRHDARLRLVASYALPGSLVLPWAAEATAAYLELIEAAEVQVRALIAELPRDVSLRHSVHNTPLRRALQRAAREEPFDLILAPRPARLLRLARPSHRALDCTIAYVPGSGHVSGSGSEILTTA